jgi:hypothetical protein
MALKERPCEQLQHACGKVDVRGWWDLMVCEMQIELGCSDCRFADQKTLGPGPCCTYCHGPEIENGECITRSLFAHA